MTSKQLEIRKGGGPVSVEVVVGQAHWGTYKIKLWDKDGKNPEVVGEGFSGDQIADEFEVGKPQSLNGRTLSWKVSIAAFDTNPAENYHVTVMIRQDGKTLPSGVFTYSGQFELVKTVGGFAKLSVK